MAPHRGYLFIADLSGYTAYLTSSEMEHATPVLASLLEVIVEQLEEPLQLWRLEGDAVCAYTTNGNFPSGETVLTLCEELYNAFRARRLDIEANSTCECRACAQVSQLDLKIMIHHGSFEEMKVGPMSDISGPDAILIHRMTKTGVRDATGIHSHALVSQAAFEAMNTPAGLVPYAETIEHFGDVQMRVYDLAAAWERLRAARQRVNVPEEDGLWTHRFHMAVPAPIAWEILVSARSKRQWMELKSVTLFADNDRPGPGARFHCVHELAEFTSWVVDWEPFHYVSHRYLSVFHPHLSHDETYELTPTDGGGTDVRYTMGPLFDHEKPDTGPYPDEGKQLSDVYRSVLGPVFDTLSKNVAENPAMYVDRS